MLPVQYRMKRSAEFNATVSRGVRAAQPDVVVHAWRDDLNSTGPRIGLVVSKSVGNAVERHLVARRLRHAARDVLDRLEPADLVVIRAKPGCLVSGSERLQQQLHKALDRVAANREARSR